MPNTYPYTQGERHTEKDPTAKDILDLDRQNEDHLHEAANSIMDTDNPENGLNASLSAPLHLDVDGGTTTWSAGWWQATDGSWWLLVRAANVASFTRAQADFYIPTGDISDVPAS